MANEQNKHTNHNTYVVAWKANKTNNPPKQT